MMYGYTVRLANSGILALKSVQTVLPDLILQDIMMPEMDGYELCTRLKAETCTRDIPVIFLSALDDITVKEKAFSVGGVDYINRPFYMEELLSSVKIHLPLQN